MNQATHIGNSDSAHKVHSVLCEVEKPSYLAALVHVLKGEFEDARIALKPVVKATALSNAGEFVFGMSAPGSKSKIQLIVK